MLIRLLLDTFERRGAGGSFGAEGTIVKAIEEQEAALEYRLAAAELRRSGLFDEKFYVLSAEARRAGMDPAVHYYRFGEARGYAPSRRFDPVFYREAYPDVAAARINCLRHYVAHGRAEGRKPLPLVNSLVLPTDRIDPNRRTIVIIVHEASRTGAPILGWNIARLLSKRFNILVLILRGGIIEEAFENFAAAVIKPPLGGTFDAGEALYLAQRLVATYRPIYAIANSVETRVIVPAMARARIPVIALVHEFSGYTRPVGVLNQVYGWAAHIVFATALVADSSRADYPILTARNVALFPQGSSVLPSDNVQLESEKRSTSRPRLKLKNLGGGLLVVGMGSVHLRKGVDLFIATAAEVRRLAQGSRVRFAWVGSGYKPEDDVQYSVYLAEQMARAGIGDDLVFVDEVSDLEPIYAQCDLFLLSSRLDPLPNVAIDAMLRGIPVICFENATGLAEILANDSTTRDLVVPHMDIGAAARLIVQLEADRGRLERLSRAVKARGRATFDMEQYVSKLDDLGQQAARDWTQIEKDLYVILNNNGFNPELYLGYGASTSDTPAAATHYLVQSHLLRPKNATVEDFYLRRPLEGFHPLSYACECAEYDANTAEDPLAHFLRSGRPEGVWTHQVIRSARPAPGSQTPSLMRTALHGHFHYPELLSDLLRRLASNRLKCDLFLTTTSGEKITELHEIARSYRQGTVSISAVPNRGRDIGPFFTHLRAELSAGYDVIGHVHGKRSPLGSGDQMGERWREFLYEHLVGDKFPMADLIIEQFANDAALGVVFPEDPYLVGWDKNRDKATKLAARIGIGGQLPDHFDFPVGTMFWARPDALKPLFDSALSWKEYPPEPIPRDGTMLHAIERLLPFVARSEGYNYATTYVSGVTR